MQIRITLSSTLVKQLLAALAAASRAGDTAAVARYVALVLYAQTRSVADTIAQSGCSRASLYSWLQILLVQGVAGLRTAARAGRPAKLTGEQKQRLRALLLAGPEAAGYSCGCWHSPLVQELIQREFGVTFHQHYLPALLAGLGFSYQKARFVSDHLDEAARTAWMQQQWPAIVAEALRRDALLLFGDEASFAQWGSLGYTWAPVGQQPLVKTTGRRKAYKVWGLLEWFGGRIFTAGQTERFTGERYCAFLETVLAQTGQPLIIIQDGARYHTGAAVREWAAAHRERVTLYQLPSYSPDYNPIEHLWRYVKEGTHGSYFPSLAALVERVETRLGELQRNAARVQQLMGTPLDDLIGQPLPVAA
jgi:transposase